MNLNTLGLAHHFIEEYVREGDLCIDATAGKGRDTALLCRLVGENGRVLAFDIQQEALAQTAALLEREGLSDRAVLYLESHTNMNTHADAGTVSCIVFNFGRLPGGDPQVFTRADSSVEAVQQGLELLRPGGVMSLSIYYGGPNGYYEREALLAFLQSVDDRKYSVLLSEWTNRPGEPPLSAFIWKDA
ncbi:MAG: class I SAM-dependent methyltransferase [Butyricicoccus sp.]|nr:class I SAM-dependent methyltransferase [Butyricicoccus sp.]